MFEYSNITKRSCNVGTYLQEETSLPYLRYLDDLRTTPLTYRHTTLEEGSAVKSGDNVM